jgi:hypothetical protein
MQIHVVTPLSIHVVTPLSIHVVTPLQITTFLQIDSGPQSDIRYNN